MATNEKMDTSMAGDEDDRKLFAGGLPQDAKEADIRGHFGQYGEIESITLKTDMATRRSRGFCFIDYKTTDGLEKAVAQAEHNIQNKKVAVKKVQAQKRKLENVAFPKAKKAKKEIIKANFYSKILLFSPNFLLT